MESERYPTGTSDDEWRRIRPHLPEPTGQGPGQGRPRLHGLRAILDAVFYVLGSGCPWRLAKGFAPWKTVYGRFGGWRIDGTRKRLKLLGMLATFKAVSEETGGEYSLYELTVPPQLGALPHIHHAETEAFYVLEGEVEFLKGEHTVRAEVGEFVFIPRGVVHGFRTWGRSPPGAWGSSLRAG